MDSTAVPSLLCTTSQKAKLAFTNVFLLSIANQKFFKVQYTEILIDSSLFITDLFSSSSQTYLAIQTYLAT